MPSDATRSPVPEIALEVWGVDATRILATARSAEKLGFAALYYGESPHALNLETWTILAALSGQTTTLRLGPVITNLLPSYRSFPLLVRQVHAVAVLSGGRLDLRTGTGADCRFAQPWWAPAGIDYPDRSARRRILAEWLAAYDRLWDAPGAAFQGEHLAFEAIRLEPAISRPPVTVAAVGPASMAIAASHADVWEASHLTPEEFRRLDERFREIAGPAGRRITRSLEVDAVLAPTEPQRRTAEAHFLAERGGGGADYLTRALTGPVEAVAERLADYATSGVERLVVACVDPFDRAALEILAAATLAVAGDA